MSFNIQYAIFGGKIVSVLHLVKQGPGKCPKLPTHNMLPHVTICLNTSVMRPIQSFQLELKEGHI